MTTPRNTLRAAATALPLALAAAIANANVVTAYWTNFNTYGYEIIQMPDLDQRRATMPGQEGLPGNGGMYCVPTSTMNMLCYAANHGFPDIGPGPGNYQSQSKYATATANLKLMGVIMGTQPGSDGGTNGAGWDNGLDFWIQYVSGDDANKLTYTHKYASGYYSPKLPDLAFAAKNGALVSFAYGRYDIIGSYDGLPIVDRDGGHVVTLAKAQATGGYDHEMWIRDPADDAMNLFSQSPFGLNYRTVEQRIVYTDDDPNAWRLVSHITNISSDSNWRIIDEYVALKPKAGYSFQPGSSFLEYYAPYGGFTIGGGGNNIVQIGEPLLELVIGPDAGVMVGVLYDADTEQGKLVKLDPTSGQQEVLAPNFNYGILAFGRKDELYASDGNKLYCFDYHNEVQLTAANSSFPSPGALAYDDLNDKLIALSTQFDVVGVIPEQFNGPVQFYELPAAFNLASNADVAVGPDGMIWIASPNEDAVGGFMVQDGVLLQMEALDFDFDDPEHVAVDDAGHVFICASDELREFAKNEAGKWYEVDSDFPGAVAGCFMIDRSRTNFDPELHSGPKWRHTEPEDLEVGPFIADCPGDVDADGDVDSADLNLILGAFGATLGGDINHDGATNSTDLNLVLTNYGNVCDDG